jgi:hypothetical protein
LFFPQIFSKILSRVVTKIRRFFPFFTISVRPDHSDGRGVPPSLTSQQPSLIPNSTYPSLGSEPPATESPPGLVLNLKPMVLIAKKSILFSCYRTVH